MSCGGVASRARHGGQCRATQGSRPPQRCLQAPRPPPLQHPHERGVRRLPHLLEALHLDDAVEEHAARAPLHGDAQVRGGQEHLRPCEKVGAAAAREARLQCSTQSGRVRLQQPPLCCAMCRRMPQAPAGLLPPGALQARCVCCVLATRAGRPPRDTARCWCAPTGGGGSGSRAPRCGPPAGPQAGQGGTATRISSGGCSSSGSGPRAPRCGPPVGSDEHNKNLKQPQVQQLRWSGISRPTLRQACGNGVGQRFRAALWGAASHAQWQRPWRQCSEQGRRWQ